MRNIYHLKGIGYYINEDFSEATLNIRAGLWDEVMQLREGYYAVIKYDRIATSKLDENAREQVCSIKNLCQNIKH